MEIAKIMGGKTHRKVVKIYTNVKSPRKIMQINTIVKSHESHGNKYYHKKSPKIYGNY